VKQRVEGAAATAPLSPGILAEGRFVYVSGQVPVRDGQRIEGGIEAETRAALDNVGDVLRAAGATFADVVSCRVYLADIDDFPAMNGVYKTYFSEPLPTRTTIGAPLVGGVGVEIDCVAVLD
jgi:2-iminobutanoate/2-iminopropanoate deaminase